MPEPECGCYVVTVPPEGDFGAGQRITHCPLHAAAGEMLAALKRIAMLTSQIYSNACPWCERYTNHAPDCPAFEARTAIAAATRAAPSATTPAPTTERTS